MWYNDVLGAFAIPFPGADRSVVQRSQYYDAVENHARPIAIETYMLVKSQMWAVLLMLWVALFAFFVQFGFTRKFMQNYPDLCSFHLFKNSGPTRQQVKEASFTYWIFGKGWDSKDPKGNEVPTKVRAARCNGPDAGYVSVSLHLIIFNEYFIRSLFRLLAAFFRPLSPFSKMRTNFRKVAESSPPPPPSKTPKFMIVSPNLEFISPSMKMSNPNFKLSFFTLFLIYT